MIALLLLLSLHPVTGFVLPVTPSCKYFTSRNYNNNKNFKTHLISLQSNNDNDDNDNTKKKQKRKKKKLTTKWIACTSTKEVNKAIKMYVRPGDTVAELGSQLRDTSTTICETITSTGQAYLVDVKRKYPKIKLQRQERMTAMRRCGDDEHFYKDRATFLEVSTFDLWRQALFFQQRQYQHLENNDEEKGNRRHPEQYDALIVDVSTIAGNDLELTCISLVREFIALNNKVNDSDNYDDDSVDNPCRVVIVKSGSLHGLGRRLFHAQRLFANSTSLPDSSNHNLDKETSIIGTVGVEEYRRTIPYTVKKRDIVLEVGSHFGTTTAILDKAARNDDDIGGCLGVDVGINIIASAKKKFPDVPFEVGDAWKMADLIHMKDSYFHMNQNTTLANNTPYYDVVYVDVGGLSGNEGLLEALSLIGSITNCLEPRCIVIKSLCIRRLASCLVPFSQIWKEERDKLL